MSILISCLMPTYNRFPDLNWIVNEAVESFLRQDFVKAELIICNDTPGQTLAFDHPRVRVFNLKERFSNLCEKIQFMIDRSRGEMLTRWDDDDISLPHRLSYSFDKLGDSLEWRPENYWYNDEVPFGLLKRACHVGNTHVMSLWCYGVLGLMGGSYPKGLSMGEDQAFNQAVARAGIRRLGEVIPDDEMFYIYRWDKRFRNLSSKTTGLHDGSHYEAIGQETIKTGAYVIRPKWSCDYTRKARATALKLVRTAG